MPEQVNGFGQVHVSGTGGGCKYGNILIQPFTGALEGTSHIDYREKEDIRLGYYGTTYQKSGIQVEVTTAERASFYAFTFKEGDVANLLFDAGFYLGETSNPEGREAQQFVGSEIQVLNEHAVSGYSRIRGGWNNGKAYTVYFYAETDQPIQTYKTWKELTQVQIAQNQKAEGLGLSSASYQYDDGHKTGALVSFGSRRKVQVKVGISFVSERKARENALKEIPHWDFNRVYQNLLEKWEEPLSKIELSESTSEDYKRMFYTGIYHAMLMPVDRTGDNPGWNDKESYYDDFYAIWDTYRTSTPLITLLEPDREVAIVNALLNIYKRDGYMPDARSGNSNGRTQGGSNAEIVIADALAKGLKGIDYNLALEAMLKDATTPPGGNEEAEGRGGLMPYLQNGYIPYGIPRAGTRTVEYSFCDWAIAQVAKHLGKKDLYEQYMHQSRNWKNLWRTDYTQDGVKGFVMPKGTDGNWLDHITFGHSKYMKPTFLYTPDTSYEGPWYMPWWSCFFYEASSWEYSLSVPHDVPGLIEACGGPDAFEKRLDTFFNFEKGYYNVANEPSFLTPCLYNWIGKSEKTSKVVRDIIQKYYSAAPDGLPGNDDSGSMSSWLVFHMMGLYPNAGHDYYLLHAPLVREVKWKLSNGKTLRITTEGNLENGVLQQITWNGKQVENGRITHQQIMEGGVLSFTLKTDKKNRQKFTPQLEKNISLVREKKSYTYLYTFSLHGQTRRFSVNLERKGGNLVFDWGIERNLKWWTGTYTMTANALENARQLCYVQPLNGQHLSLETETFGVLSRAAWREIKKNGKCLFNRVEYQLVSQEDGKLLLRDSQEKSEMVVADDEELPIIWSMQNNPVEINWKVDLLP
jgi:predicted alpha-1,2-mannosidase